MSFVKGFFAGLVWLFTSILRVAAAGVASIVLTLAFTILTVVSGAMLGIAQVNWVRYGASLPPISSMSRDAYLVLGVHFVVTVTVSTWALMTIVFAFKECDRRAAAVASWCMRVGKSQNEQRERITITSDGLEPHPAG